MILAENRQYLQKRFPKVLELIRLRENEAHREELKVISAKNGQPSLQVLQDDKYLQLHSLYNPEAEAQAWVNGYEDLQAYDHIFVYGIGLGYHLEALMNKYPNHQFTVYEPEFDIFLKWVECRNINYLGLKLANMYTEVSERDVDLFLSHFVGNIKDEVKIVYHPSYERLFRNKTETFTEKFKFHLKNKRSAWVTNVGFERLWTLNSVMNFEKVIQTPNIFGDLGGLLKNKPAIIVAAGPSLQDEFENLKYIKEKRLAYIFAVGSANKALINNGIYPDAVFSYDPLHINQAVFSEIVERKIDTIPMIFGSTIGYQTLQQYPGPMMHMITSQDKVAPFYIGDKLEIIGDAPTISVLALETLAKLECTTVILVGQNFAFRDDKFYSEGVNYSFRSIDLNETERSSIEFVESVDGGQVATYDAHNRGRRQMESYIQQLSHVEVINTTKGGAQITGTHFMSLDEVIKDRFNVEVVDSNWYKVNQSIYDRQHMVSQSVILDRSFKEMNELSEEMIKHMRKMDEWNNKKDLKNIKRSFLKFDKLFKKILQNKYIEILIRPMLRVQFELLQKQIMEIREEANSFKKSERIIHDFGKILYHCQQIQVDIQQLLGKQFHEHINEMLERVSLSKVG